MNQISSNPLLNLDYQLALETLGDDFYDQVNAANFPENILRFRNNQILESIGLDSKTVKDDDFIECFGKFKGIRPFLALRYHGYQFGSYNPQLGDGRGFIYGQVLGHDNLLYDFGTKGSGTTPYSRNADGRLTLKGGVREVLAAEALHQLGVNTSRCFSLIETGEALWRGDEPSPTRSSVMVRFSKSHIRFGTFERLNYLQRPDLIKKLLDYVIEFYYDDLKNDPDGYLKFYDQLVERVALLTAQWMVAGFCHGVLNTDNMSITGESFDYGPYAFIPNYNPSFIAAYFDYGGRYSYGNQPFICKLNLELLQKPLSYLISTSDLELSLTKFDDYYTNYYQNLMLNKLGFDNLPYALGKDLVKETINLLSESQYGYHQFFRELTELFNLSWCDNPQIILENLKLNYSLLESWQKIYHQALQSYDQNQLNNVSLMLEKKNPKITLLRPIIESVWQSITEEDNWQPFNELVQNLQNKV